MGFLLPKAPDVNLSVPKQAPVPPVVMAQDTRPKKKPMSPTFLGSEATPQMAGSAAGPGYGKTLLGA